MKSGGECCALCLCTINMYKSKTGMLAVYIDLMSKTQAVCLRPCELVCMCMCVHVCVCACARVCMSTSGCVCACTYESRMCVCVV